MGSILFLLAFKLILLYLIYKAFLEMGIGFDSTLLLPKSERLFQLFALNSLTFFDSIGVIISRSVPATPRSEGGEKSLAHKEF